MRLIQQEPAWSLHAYLRFLNADYSTENSFASKALGLQLPIIVDEVVTKTESLAMSYLSNRYSHATSEMSADAVFSAYLKQSLVVPFLQLKRLDRTDRNNVFRVLPIGLNVAFSIVDDIHEYLCGDRFDPLPGAKEDELISSVARVYSEINDSLLLKIAQGQAPTFTQLHGHLASADNDEDQFEADHDRLTEAGRTSPTANSSNVEAGCQSPNKAQQAAMQGGGIAEAVLFGHIAAVLCTHEKLAAVLVRYEGLLIFFQYICATYFTDPYIDATTENSDALHWKSSMDALLASKFLDQEACAPVKACLLYGTPIPCTGLPEPPAAQNSSEDDFYPTKEGALNDTNPLSKRGRSQSLVKTAPERAGLVAQNGDCVTDLYLVSDEPTQLGKLNLDLSFSAPWRSSYNHIMGVLGYPRQGSSNVPAVMPPAGVHTVGLGGVALLMGVAGCFGGYAFYTSRSRR